MLRKNIVLGQSPSDAATAPAILARPSVRPWGYAPRPLFHPPAQPIKTSDTQSAPEPHPDGQCDWKSCSHIALPPLSFMLIAGSGASDIIPCVTPSPAGGLQVGPRAVFASPLATRLPSRSAPPPTCRVTHHDSLTDRVRRCPSTTRAHPGALPRPDLWQVARNSTRQTTPPPPALDTRSNILSTGVAPTKPTHTQIPERMALTKPSKGAQGCTVCLPPARFHRRCTPSHTST